MGFLKSILTESTNISTIQVIPVSSVINGISKQLSFKKSYHQLVSWFGECTFRTSDSIDDPLCTWVLNIETNEDNTYIVMICNHPKFNDSDPTSITDWVLFSKQSIHSLNMFVALNDNLNNIQVI